MCDQTYAVYEYIWWSWWWGDSYYMSYIYNPSDNDVSSHYTYTNDQGDKMYAWTKSLNYFYMTTWSYNDYYFNHTYYYYYQYFYTYNYETGYWYYDNNYTWDSYFELYTNSYKYNLLYYRTYEYMNKGYWFWTYTSYYDLDIYFIGNVDGRNGNQMHSEFTYTYGYFFLPELGPSVDASTIVTFMNNFTD